MFSNSSRYDKSIEIDIVNLEKGPAKEILEVLKSVIEEIGFLKGAIGPVKISQINIPFIYRGRAILKTPFDSEEISSEAMLDLMDSLIKQIYKKAYEVADDQ